MWLVVVKNDAQELKMSWKQKANNRGQTSVAKEAKALRGP
jgi:hypothetical protein